jgi:glutamine amidotransferase
MGNLRSVQKALEKLGHDAEVTADPAVIATADRLILPGVGAFGAAMGILARGDGDRPALLETVKAAARDALEGGRPFLGICLGMQLLFPESEEAGLTPGLGVIPGRVRRFDAAAYPKLKIPHMGWNTLHFPRSTALFAGVEEGASVYFVHSYFCTPRDSDSTAATATHGVEFCAALTVGNLFAAQFHPEKSGTPGLKLLDNFARM